MTEKKEFQVNKNTPFWDASLTDQERIDWLLKEMTVEEKLGYLASSSPDLPRLGIPGVSVGGEAAHALTESIRPTRKRTQPPRSLTRSPTMKCSHAVCV